MEISQELLERYDRPVPRYTSYPTVPVWNAESLTTRAWENAIRLAATENPQVSLYLHLPFCEKLCTYCGCNKKVTNNHAVEDPYIQALLKEWTLYLKLFPVRPVIREIHLGGGTPTFFSPENLSCLLDTILDSGDISQFSEGSVEVHPVVTTRAHLEALASKGFTRLSAGVQDFDPEVQRLINRIQTPEQTREVIEAARELGFTAINLDIIYGLPRQTLKSIELTIEEVLKIRPERIAFYSYAHVPWKSPGQRLYDESDLPSGTEKRKLYELGRKLLLEAGYSDIGMDHFALEVDPLWKAWQSGTLHRNFMGYTTEPEGLLIGLGASAISDAGTAFHQNEKDIKKYQTMVEDGRYPYLTGHLLSHEDRCIRKVIQEIMCQGESGQALRGLTDERLEGLRAMETEGLVLLSEEGLKVTPKGMPFIRNICSWIDRYFQTEGKESLSPVFSKSL